MTNTHIEQEHPDYTAKARMWRRYRDLYAGGEQFRSNAAEYLLRRQKEPLEVYQERLARVFYENYLGSIVDWYTATLVRREPILEFAGTNDPAKDFFGRFVQNCDLRGTTLTQFFKQQMTEALVCGKSYVVVDFPRTDGPALTRADEDESGRSRAYLVAYNADELINWSHDQQGELEWVVIRTSLLKQDSVKSFGWKRETRWIYYDREKFEIYERRGADQKSIELTDQGKHGFAGIGRVPVFELKVSDGLWLTNKIALLQLEHFNKSNALGWALTMGLFAMPVIYSDKEFNQVTGESYYLQLGSADRFGWTEPAGNVFQIAADNLSRLKDEIYRVSYLVQQAGDSTGSVQSGLSHQWDFSVTQEILRSYGATVKDSIRNVLGAISTARQDELEVDAMGLDEFDITDFSTEASDAKSLLSLGIQSPTLTKQVQKRVALKYLCDARQEVKNRIAAEIDAVVLDKDAGAGKADTGGEEKR
jgi:hypothetical protein